MGTCKLIVRLAGGLGNQLFTYAAAKRLAIVNNADLLIDAISGFARDFVYRQEYQLKHFAISGRLASRQERLEPCSRLRRALLREFSKRTPFDRRPLIFQEFRDFDPRLLALRFESTRYLEGYWQSEQYFQDIAPIIRSEFEMPPPPGQWNEKLTREIVRSESIALHIRFFDDQSPGTTNNVATKYYSSAIELMKSRFPDASYFLFSDNLSRAMDLVKQLKIRVTPSENNSSRELARADLWLMSHCKHFIIANSTFSWWGAWLSKNADKFVISPGVVEGTKTAWGFEGLIPETWHVIHNP
jgi:hypothetical protein